MCSELFEIFGFAVAAHRLIYICDSWYIKNACNMHTEYEYILQFIHAYMYIYLSVCIGVLRVVGQWLNWGRPSTDEKSERRRDERPMRRQPWKTVNEHCFFFLLAHSSFPLENVIDVACIVLCAVHTLSILDLYVVITRWTHAEWRMPAQFSCSFFFCLILPILFRP